MVHARAGGLLDKARCAEGYGTARESAGRDIRDDRGTDDRDGCEGDGAESHAEMVARTRPDVAV